MKKHKAPALTLNVIRPRIAALVGLERQSRTDIKILPWEADDDALGSMGTELIKHSMVLANGARKLSQCFQQGAICGRGWFEVHGSLDQPITISLESNPAAVLPDPSSREEDLSDADYVLRERWVSLRFAREQWPEKKRELDATSAALGFPGVDGKGFGTPSLRTTEEKRFEPEPYTRAFETGAGVPDPALIDVQNGRIKIVEMWHRRTEKVYRVLDSQGNVVLESVGSRPSDDELAVISASLAEANESARLRGEAVSDALVVDSSETRRTMWLTVIGAGVVLQDERSPYRDDLFPWVPYYALVTHGIDEYSTRGMVADLIDPQRLKNKARSQALNHLNRSTNSGHFYFAGTVDNPEMVAEDMSTPGAFVEVKGPPGSQPVPMHPAEYSQAHANAELAANFDFETISGIGEDFRGVSSDAESGIQAQVRIQRSQISIFELFDNFRLTKRMLGRLMLSRIGQFWSMERMRRILGERRWEQGGYAVAAQRLIEGDVQFDVTVDETVNSPNYRLAVLQTLSNMAKTGMPVPPEAILELVDLPPEQKQLLLQHIAAERQARAAEAAAQGQAQGGEGAAPAPPAPAFDLSGVLGG